MIWVNSILLMNTIIRWVRGVIIGRGSKTSCPNNKWTWTIPHISNTASNSSYLCQHHLSIHRGLRIVSLTIVRRRCIFQQTKIPNSTIYDNTTTPPIQLTLLKISTQVIIINNSTLLEVWIIKISNTQTKLQALITMRQPSIHKTSNNSLWWAHLNLFQLKTIKGRSRINGPNLSSEHHLAEQATWSKLIQCALSFWKLNE